MTSLEDQQALLLYRVGPVLCCAPSLSVLSIIQPVPLTHPPGTDPARPGIFRHSSQVIKTEELRVRFGVDEADRRPGRLIIVEVDSGPTAFWVDDIIDVISMPTTGWGQPPPYLPRGIFSRTLLLNDKIYLYAEFDALQKLQGHGLLKTYIDKLLAEKQPPPAVEIPAAATSTPPVQKATKRTQQTVTDKTASPSVATIESPGPENNAAAEPATRTETGLSKKTPLPTTTPKSTAKTSTGGAANTHKPALAAVNRKTATTLSPPAAGKPTATAAKPGTQPTLTAKQSATAPQAKATKAPLATTGSTPSGQKPAPAPSGSPFMVLFMGLLLLLATGGGLYYYFLATPQTITTTSVSIDIPDKYQPPEPVTPPEPDITPAPPPLVAVQAVPEKPLEVAATPAVKTTPPDTSTATAATDSTYQARIDQDAEGITIVIKAPQEESVLKEDANAKPTQPVTTTADTATETAAEVADPAVKKVPPSKTKVAQRQEILHIVVKGDTLWGIAKRYVNNPFRYPELARLSNIKNPDLIYPGNRVRIIREFN